MVRPNLVFHYAAFLIMQEFANTSSTIMVGDCKPPRPDDVEDQRTDFTLKVVANNTIVCYLVFRMTSFASANKFDVLSNVKLYDANFTFSHREYRVSDYPTGRLLSDILIHDIRNLIGGVL